MNKAKERHANHRPKRNSHDMKIRARILSLDGAYPPMVRLILTKRIGNVIRCYICRMKAKDVPMCVFNRYRSGE